MAVDTFATRLLARPLRRPIDKPDAKESGERPIQEDPAFYCHGRHRRLLHFLRGIGGEGIGHGRQLTEPSEAQHDNGSTALALPVRAPVAGSQ
jgi:hypothetical protein